MIPYPYCIAESSIMKTISSIFKKATKDLAKVRKQADLEAKAFTEASRSAEAIASQARGEAAMARQTSDDAKTAIANFANLFGVRDKA